MITLMSLSYPSAKSPLSGLFKTSANPLSLSYRALKRLHCACAFDRNVKVVVDKTLGQVSLVGKNFAIVCSHDSYPKGNAVTLFKNKGSDDFSFVRSLTSQDLFSSLLINELKGMF